MPAVPNLHEFLHVNSRFAFVTYRALSEQVVEMNRLLCLSSPRIGVQSHRFTAQLSKIGQ